MRILSQTPPAAASLGMFNTHSISRFVQYSSVSFAAPLKFVPWSLRIALGIPILFHMLAKQVMAASVDMSLTTFRWVARIVRHVNSARPAAVG